MTVYKIDENCKGDCEKWPLGDAIIFYVDDCLEKDSLRINNIVIPCGNLYFERDYYRSMEKGERFRFAKNIYIEYGEGQRVYLDYKKYLTIYNLAKLFKKVKYLGIEFEYDNILDRVKGPPLYYFNPDYIEFLSVLSEKFYVLFEDGVKGIFVDGTVTIKRGECRYVNDNLLLCYGDPE